MQFVMVVRLDDKNIWRLGDGRIANEYQDTGRRQQLFLPVLHNS
jgi:hypothetical protein